MGGRVEWVEVREEGWNLRLYVEEAVQVEVLGWRSGSVDGKPEIEG